jgi:hypothetical protein
LSEEPEYFDLPAQWEALEAAIGAKEAPEFGSEVLGRVLERVREHEPTRALVETDYIDADYRDEYTHFYSKTFAQLADRCRRVHFFKLLSDGSRERYLGYCVLRPLRSRPVGRTVLTPPDSVRSWISCTIGDVVHPYGQRLRTWGFPFMEQDTQLGVCAHASVWMVALYHHLAFGKPRRFMHDIADAAQTQRELWRPTPSEGLSDQQVSVALQQLDLEAITYVVSSPPNNQSINRVICRYLNSRLPVILTTEQHAVVLIGYGRDRKNRLFFVRQDDGHSPYERVYKDSDPLGDWDLLFTPLPGKVYLAGESAEPFARRMLTQLLDSKEHRKVRARLPNYLRLRTYLVSAGEYKARLARRGLPALAVDLHRKEPTSNWIWVVELQDPKLARTTVRCVIGEMAIDATSDSRDPNPFFANLEGVSYIWEPGTSEPLAEEVGYEGPYVTGCALHDAATAPVLPKAPIKARARAWGERRSRFLARRSVRTRGRRTRG